MFNSDVRRPRVWVESVADRAVHTASSAGGVGGLLVVTIGGNEVQLASGERLSFGRDAGPGQVTTDDRRISGQHGFITAEEHGWSVSSTASFFGFSVYDCESPSKLHVPLGAGPVPVPFAWAVITIDIKGDRHVLEVRTDGAPRWSSGWSVARLEEEIDDDSTSHTVPALHDIRHTDRRGRVLRWYQVLVAMCEPRFEIPPRERIPSNAELAARLGIKQRPLENHHLDRLRRELGFQKFDDQSRLAAVVIALNQGVVTRNDLTVLELPADDD